MTVEQALEFFAALPKIRRALDLLAETGLGYLQLGQPSPTLSGGEAQRIKLVTQLTRRLTAAAEEIKTSRRGKSTVYILEEPTIGLHAHDVTRLIQILHRLTDEGGTVIVIEHHLDVIAEADYVIDLGPEAGTKGGEIVAVGTPEEIAKSQAQSHGALHQARSLLERIGKGVARKSGRFLVRLSGSMRRHAANAPAVRAIPAGCRFRGALTSAGRETIVNLTLS